MYIYSPSPPSPLERASTYDILLQSPSPSRKEKEKEKKEKTYSNKIHLAWISPPFPESSNYSALKNTTLAHLITPTKSSPRSEYQQPAILHTSHAMP